MKKGYVALLMGMVVAPGLAWATEVPPITPAEFSGQEAHWIWSALASEIVVVVAGWIVAQFADRIKETRHAAALTAIRDAVTACYHEYVRGIKAGKADGKLTAEEKDEALNLAYRSAVEFARTRGIDLLKVYAKETVIALIERFVGESKSKAVKVAAPLPDLAP